MKKVKDACCIKKEHQNSFGRARISSGKAHNNNSKRA